MRKAYLWGGGAGACEIYHIISDLNKIRNSYEIIGVVGKVAPDHPELAGVDFIDISQTGWQEHINPAGCAFITSGTPRLRKIMYEEAKVIGLELPVLCHPSAVISPDTFISEGCIVGPNTTISSLVRLKHNVYLSFNASIGHHTVIDEHCFFSPGTRVGGRIICSSRVFTGMNAVILNGVTVGTDANISACSLVASAVPDGATVIHSKSRILKLG